MINVYRSNSLSEVLGVLPALDDAHITTLGLLARFNDNEMLLAIARAIERFKRGEAARFPLMRYLVGLETLLMHVDKWDSAAPLAFKYSQICASFKTLTQTVVRWRRLEVDSWANVMRDREEDLVRETTESFFMHLHELISACLSSSSSSRMWEELCGWMDDEGRFLVEASGSATEEETERKQMRIKDEETWFALDAFARTSTMGDFAVRLELLEAFGRFLRPFRDAPPDENRTRLGLSNTLINLSRFYAQFLPALEELKTTQSRPLEKRLKDQVKIAKWDDRNYFSLKESAERSHRAIHKIVKEYDELLRSPVHPFVDGDWTRPDVGREVVRAGGRAERHPELPSSEVGAGGLINNKMKDAFERTRTKLLAGLQTPFALVSELSAGVESLQRPESGVQAKQRGVAELLREIKKQGLLKDLSPLIPPPAVVRAREARAVLGVSALLDASVLPGEVEALFFGNLSHATRLRNAHAKGVLHKDLTEADYRRAMQCADALAAMALQQRAAISTAQTETRELEALLAMRGDNVSVGNSKRHLASLLACARDAHAALSRISTGEVPEVLNEAIRMMVEANEENARQIAEKVAEMVGEYRASPSTLLTEILLEGVVQEARRVAEGQERGVTEEERVNTDRNGMELENDLERDLKLAIQACLEENPIKNVPVIQPGGHDSEDIEEDDTLPTLVETHFLLMGVRRRARFSHLLERLQIARSTKTATLVPLVAVLSRLHAVHTAALVEFHVGLLRVARAVLVLFRALGEKGFCRPAEEEEEEKDKGDAPHEQDAREGTGMGEGKGIGDVTNEIEDEEQLLGLRGEKEEEKDRAAPKPNNEEEQEGIEMQNDFEGEMEDVQQEQEEEQQEEEQEGEEEEELDREMGDTAGEDERVVDEAMFDSDDEEGEDDKEEEKFEKNAKTKGERTGETRTREDDEENEGSGRDEAEEDDARGEGGEDDEAEDHEEEGAIRKEEEIEESHDVPVKDQEEGEGSDFEMPQENGEDVGEDGDESSGEEGGEERDDDDDGEGDSVDEIENAEAVEELPEETQREEEDMTPAATANEEMADPRAAEEARKQAAGVRSRSSTGGGGKDSGTKRGGGQEETRDDDDGDDDPEKGIEEEENSNEMEDGGSGVQGECDDRTGKARRGERRENEADPPEEEEDEGAAAARNPFKDAGEAARAWAERLKMIERAGLLDANDAAENEGGEGEEYEFAQRVEGKEQKQTLAPGVTSSEEKDEENNNDDARFLPDEERAEKTREEEAIEEEEEARDDDAAEKGKGRRRGAMREKDVREEEMESSHTEQEQGEEEMELETPAYDTPASSFAVTAVEAIRAGAKEEKDEENNEDHHATEEGAPDLTPGELARGEATWSRAVAHTSEMSQRLCEQLRLVLEPTLATKMRGDYRTGKRLNMRRVIAYVASDYKKDKIWMRRTRPSGREYHVAMAIDDSRSMRGCAEMAMAALALIARALSQLESGELAVFAFGESVREVHPLGGVFSEEAGARCAARFRFDQNSTCIEECLKRVVGALSSARARLRQSSAAANNSGGSAPAPRQIAFFISDGRFDSGLRARMARWVRAAQDRQQLVVLVIVEDPRAGQGSIVDLKQATVDPQTGAVRMTRYLDDYPFPYYVVLRDMQALPETLADALRQWFEVLAASSSSGSASEWGDASGSG